MRRAALSIIAASILAAVGGTMVEASSARPESRAKPQPEAYTPSPKSEHAPKGHSAKMRAKLERRAKRLFRD